MTIEERANKLTDFSLHDGIKGTIRHTYIYAATEQRKLDVDKACLIYHKELSEIIGILNHVGEELYGISELGELIHLGGSVKDFRKAMEEELC